MYFIVSENHQLAKDYRSYEINRDKTVAMLNEFLADRNMKPVLYYADNQTIHAKFEEKTMWNGDMVKASDDHGCRAFRKPSKVAREWRKLLKEKQHRVTWQPRPSPYLGYGFRASWRFVESNGRLYLYYDTDVKVEPIEGFTEILSSEFNAADEAQ